MRVLKALVGSDHDSNELLAIARYLPVRRIVVKRPRHAPPLADKKPNGFILTKNHRFDLYLPLLSTCHRL